ncbi:hypothetical protein LCGC14_2545440 [marine sediment metagenome]|uniref:Uncharacterized protein n=1 Tax=marine sediment metagenome TaxID=412755 RepID=A0A0F9D0X0_9ZZZZ
MKKTETEESPLVPWDPKAKLLPPTSEGKFYICQAMSLRDHFAGLAMAAFASQPEVDPFYLLIRRAYRLADAMLAERKKGRTNETDAEAIGPHSD